MVRPTTGKSLCRTGLVILLLLNLPLLWSEENRAVVGRDFSVIIQTDFPYSPDIKVDMPELPENVIISSNPYIRSYRREEITEGRREYQTLTEVRYKIRASQPGIYQIPGALVQREGKEQSLEPFYFMAFLWDEYRNSYPLKTQWREVPKEIYQGQTVPLLLEALYTDSIIFPDNLNMYQPAGGTLERVSLPGEIEILHLDEEHQVYRYPLESWIFSSQEPGTIHIPAGEVLINGLKRPIPPLTLEILELPEALQGSGAVGQFHRFIEIEEKALRQGDSLEITLRLEGRGNLPQLHLGNPDLEGWELISHQDELDILPDSQWGYVGSRRYTFQVHALKTGVSEITFERFPFWNPESRKLEFLPGETISINLAAPLEGEEERVVTLISPKEVLNCRDWYRVENPYVYLLLLPLVLLMLTLLIMKKQKWGPWLMVSLFFLFTSANLSQAHLSRLNLADEAFRQGKVNEALGQYLALKEDLGNNSSYLYNLSLIQRELNMPAEAELSLRTALRIRPGFPLYEEMLKQMDRDFGLENQFYGSLLLRQGLFLSAFLFSAALLMSLVVLHFIMNKTQTLLYLAATMSLFILSSLSLLYLVHQNRVEQVIVMKENAQLRKISGDLARDWIDLPAGTSLEVQTRYRNFLFIRTGYGLQGWVKDEEIATLRGQGNG